MLFVDRRDAGRQLARKLEKYRMDHPVVLGLARGGVPVAAEIAKSLGAPLDVLVVRKVGAPFQPELALGAVAGGTVWLNDQLIDLLGVPREALERIVALESAEVARRETLYRLGRPRMPVEGRTVIVVDDGLATGATASAALRALRQRSPKRIVFAVPVCSVEGAAQLKGEANDVVCHWRPEEFHAVSQAYGSFAQVSDEEVRQSLDSASAMTAANE
jgi:predicted phosphoribosyltransferase